MYRANPPQTNKIIYHCALAKKKKYFKKAKVTSWQNYVSKVNKDTPTSCVWNKIRKLLGKYVLKPLPSLLVNNNLATDPKGSSDVLDEHFSKIFSQQSFSQDFRTAAREREYPEFSSGDSECYNVLFTMQELKHAFKNTKKSSPGEDTIFADMVK